ncbi:SIS domain-containing protein [Candidatus Dependentiae bacterium]|nr:SIS domain-containing protein [Candidatus Dependentiae bacterium]
MLEEVTLWPKKLKDGLDIAHNFHYQHGAQLPRNINKIIFVGMGGSGIAGRIVKTFLDKKSKIPSFIIDTPELPVFVDTQTLAFVISYSGDTWETVSVLEQLVEMHIPTVAISHGGQVAQIAESKNIPFILLPDSKTPRSALGNFLGIILGLLDLMGILAGKDILAAFNKQLALYLPKFEEDTSYCNDFLDRANGCEGFHIWGISGDSAAFAYRAQTQFNENSKVQATTSYFPELNHNLLVGFTDCKNTPLVMFFETDFIPTALCESVEAVSGLLKERGVVLYKPPILGDTWEGQLFHILLWSDFASYYLGKARGVDIEAVDIVEDLKNRLKKKS